MNNIDKTYHNDNPLVVRLYNETPTASLCVEAGAEIQRLSGLLGLARAGIAAPTEPTDQQIIQCFTNAGYWMGIDSDQNARQIRAVRFALERFGAAPTGQQAVPVAWKNGLTGEITEDSEIGFMWELNRYDVTRLVAAPVSAAPTAAVEPSPLSEDAQHFLAIAMLGFQGRPNAGYTDAREVLRKVIQEPSTAKYFAAPLPTKEGAGEVDAKDAARLDWLLLNLHPANFGLPFEGGYDWDSEDEFFAKFRKAIDAAIAAQPKDTTDTLKGSDQ